MDTVPTCATGRQFADIPDAIVVLDNLIRPQLAALYGELQDKPWYKREQEVVSLFAFGHVAPALLREGIDIGQLTIEGRVWQSTPKRADKVHLRSKELGERVRRDLVFWEHRNDGWWRSPRPSVPLAIMEWKLGSGTATRKSYEIDVEWLTQNGKAGAEGGPSMQVGYAVLVDWSKDVLSIECKRIENGHITDFFYMGPERAKAARGE